MSERVAIQLDTLTRLADGFRESRGISGNLTTEQMITLAATPIPSEPTTSKLPHIIARTATELTAEDLAGVTEIGDYAFYKYSTLKSVTIPNSVISMGKAAFGVCENIENTYYDGDLTLWCKISLSTKENPLPYKGNIYLKNSFGEYELLTNLVIPDGIINIGSFYFSNNSSLINATIGNSVIKLNFNAMSGCKNLINVTIGDSVNTIDKYAFSSCPKLMSVRIGNGITSIDGSAFNLCTSLTDIYIDKPEGSVPNAPWGATNATIHWNTPLPSEEE